MNKKIFENARFCPKGDTEANWNKAVGFVPLDKEIIIYKKDETHSAARFKVGDGKTVVQELPFSGTDVEAIEKLMEERGELLIEYIDNAVAALPQADYEQNDPTAKDYIKNRPFYENKIALIEWDGNIEGREYIYMDNGAFYIVKVNDSIYTKEELLHDIVIGVSIDGDNYTIPISEFIVKEIPGALVLEGEVLILFVSSYEICAQETGMPFTSNGTYFFKNNAGYISDLSRIDLKKIEVKFLPDKVLECGDKIAELEDRVVTAIFEITEENTIINFQNLEDITKIDWGDGVINKSYAHIYNAIGQYICKIYDAPSISYSMLNDCGELISIIIPNNITHIDMYAFLRCSNLTNVVIGDNVTKIDRLAFSGCSKLETIDIPASVMSIEDYAFSDCANLKHLTFKNPNPITYEKNEWFDRVDNSLTHIYVPYGCSEAYKTKWAVDGASQDILDKIIESDREAMMSDLNSGLDTKLNKSGGFISGDLSIQGNLNVAGTTTTKNTETINVKDNTIVANSDGIELLEEAGFVVKTNATDAYGIMYDPVGDGVKIGLGSFDENGKFNYTEGEDQLLATRANTIVDGHTVVWDDENKTLIDSGVAHNELVKSTAFKLTHGFYSAGGYIYIASATKEEIAAKITSYKPISPYLNDYAWKVSATTNTEEWTDEEKTSACETIGALKKSTEVTTRPQVYVKAPDGTQTLITLSTDYQANAIPRYNAAGRLACADPKNDYETTNKKYVDDGFVAKIVEANHVYITDANGNQSSYPWALGSVANSIPRRTAKGQLYAEAPTEDGHTVNKRYADTNYVPIPAFSSRGRYRLTAMGKNSTGEYLTASIDVVNYGSVPTDAAIIRANANGNITVAEPVNASDAVTKNYVDTLVGDINTVLESILGV